MSKEWEGFQQSWVNNLYNQDNILNLDTELKKYPKRQLDILMPKAKSAEIADAAQQIGRLKMLDIDGVLERQATIAAAIGETLNTNNTAAINELVKRLPKDPSAQRRRIVRAAAMDTIIPYRPCLSEILHYLIKGGLMYEPLPIIINAYNSWN